jgi:hypothetical protein
MLVARSAAEASAPAKQHSTGKLAMQLQWLAPAQCSSAADFSCLVLASDGQFVLVCCSCGAPAKHNFVVV